MTKPTVSEIRRFALFFAVFFSAVSVGQYLFVQYETNEIISKELLDSAKSLNENVDYRDGIDLKDYNKATPDAGLYTVVLSDGSVLDIGLATDKEFVSDLIPEVKCPVLSAAAFLPPVKVTYTIAAAVSENWWIYAKKLDRGVVMLGISEFDDVPDAPEQLIKNIGAFGDTVEQAKHTKSKSIDNSILNWLVMEDGGKLVGGTGRIPLRTDPMALGRIPIGVHEKVIENKPYLTLYTPLTSTDGKPVGTIVVAQDIAFEKAALANQKLFNLATGGVCFLVFLIFAVIYSTRQEQQRRAIREAFQHYFSPQILEAILKEPGRLKLGGTRREVTILFSDIRSFTSLTETLAPQQLTYLLQDYFNAMTEEVFATEGIVDKFIGDAIMAFWGAPIEQPDQADRAVQTAINMTKRLEHLREKWKSEGLPVFDIGIGINLGVATVGNFGSSKRFDYTLIGDAVNCASRIEGLNKEFSSTIIISNSTKRQLTIDIATRDLGEVPVKGRDEAIHVFQVDLT